MRAFVLCRWELDIDGVLTTKDNDNHSQDALESRVEATLTVLELHELLALLMKRGAVREELLPSTPKWSSMLDGLFSGVESGATATGIPSFHAQPGWTLAA
jgi:hypothetical protein